MTLDTRTKRFILLGLILSVVVAVVVSQFASSSPDGLEYVADSQGFTDKIVFWRKQQDPSTAIDPDKEARRIRENQATGKPLTEGETPIIQRRQKGLLER